MATIDYKEKYEAALAVAQETYNTQPMYREWLESMFPELKESEDEKIRKELLSVVNGLVLTDEQQSRFVAWLERQGEHAKFRDSIQVGDKVTRNQDGVLVNLSQLKRVAKHADKQGEQKPAWSEDDEKLVKNLISTLSNLYARNLIEKETKEKYTNWLKSLKDRVQPKQEWSESDEVRLNRIAAALDNLKVADNDILLKDIAWLKSLRPQNRWKPTERQIYLLNWVANILLKDDGIVEKETAKELQQLLEQLKKLRGE